jgi:hypothetical protein
MILSIGYFPMLFGMSVIEHRWWYFAQILLALPLAFVVMGAAKIKLWVAGLLVAIMAFLSIVGLPVNMDNHTFSQNQLVRYALTQPEIDALHDIDRLYPKGNIATDAFYATSAVHMLSYNIVSNRIVPITDGLLSGDFSGDYNIILIRQEILDHSIADGGGVIYRINYDPGEVLGKQGFVEVYNNGAVRAYERVPNLTNNDK